MSATYRDLFLLAAVIARSSYGSSSRGPSDGLLRLRLTADPPEQSVWMRLGHEHDESIRDLPLSGEFDFTELLHAARCESASMEMLRPAIERTWRLFADWLPQALRQHILPNVKIRLNVVTSTPSLWSLPWEWLEEAIRDAIPTAEIAINRAVPIRLAAPRLVLRTAPRVLVLPSNPKDERKMDVGREVELLNLPTEVPREVANASSSSELLHKITTYQPNVVHYIGHAGIDGQEGSLILEGPSGSTVWVDISSFDRIVFPSVRLVCLATCITAQNYDIRGFARFALGDSATKPIGLPSIVYTQFPISEISSSTFWNTFYTSLCHGRADLTAAVAAGRAAVRKNASNSIDWSSFVLVLRDQFGADPGSPWQVESSSTARAAFTQPEAVPDAASFHSDELQSYFASQLANMLEALHADAQEFVGERNEDLLRIRSEIDRVKGYIK